MKYFFWTIAALAVATLIFFAISFAVSGRQSPVAETNPDAGWETKIDEQASVTVTVTPIDMSSQSKEWKFAVAMDTHSVELGQDLLATATLIDNQGEEYKPTRWDGPTGGHHREGVLVFSRITPIPSSIQLEITDIGDIKRNFTWQLK